MNTYTLAGDGDKGMQNPYEAAMDDNNGENAYEIADSGSPTYQVAGRNSPTFSKSSFSSQNTLPAINDQPGKWRKST